MRWTLVSQVRALRTITDVLLSLSFLGSPVLLRAQCAPATLPIIPCPVDVQPQSGTCILTAATPIHFDPEFANVAAILAGYLGTDPTLPAATGTRIEFRRAEVPMGDEGYELRIGTDRLRVVASTAAGAFYAVQSIRQLLPSNIEGGGRSRAWRLPCMSVSDQPRFAWRGLMLDCSRHFMPVQDIKRIIEQIAALKLNRFHWHLTDDQGWRLEIRAYPELTNVGAWRQEGPYRHGGYYTKEEVRDIVSFAAKRHITVVPEIDLPGHTSAALASYPWLGCSQKPIPVPRDWGIFTTVLCAGRESTFQFVEAVLEEVAELFPSRWIHVGGDECPTDEWDACDSCQASIARDGLPGSYALQWRFTRRVEDMLSRLGKVPIGWNEIMAGASRSTVIQAWHNLKVAIDAAKADFTVLSSPIDPCYLNFTDSINTLAEVYRFDPLARQGWPDEGRALMGVECCLWTEAMPTPVESDMYIFPRIAAFAEAAWSDPASKDWECFRTRIAVHGGRWSQAGQRFAAHADISWDDGAPLTVNRREATASTRSHLSFSDRMQGSPEIVLKGDVEQAGSSPPPRVLAFDDSSLDIEHGFSSRDMRPLYAIQGVRKPGHPWCELSDSASIDGLYYIKPHTSVRAELSVHCHPLPLRLDGDDGVLTIRLKLPEPGAADIALFDILGRLVHRETAASLPYGESIVQLPLSSIAAGAYIMRISVLGYESIHRVLVTR